MRADLIEFNAALVATSFADDAAIAETAPIAERALGRALAAVFPAPAPSLKALRQASHISMREIASRLSLSVDIVSLLEQGRIAASSVPERLVRALGEALGTASEQISAALQGQPALAPALQRNRTAGQRKDATPPPPLTFAEAVRLSPGMTQLQKDAWLAAD
jgi:transcriptional regulator with XRE-family HTH domain